MRGLPERPDRVYADWPGWRSFLGLEYLSYLEAQRVIQEAGISNARQYVARYREFPGLPSAPDEVYEEWAGWRSFIGLPWGKAFLSYEEASVVARAAGITSYREYVAVYRQYPGLPSTPNKEFPEWEGWRVFLGVREVLTYEEARAVVLTLGIRTAEEYAARYREHLGLRSSPYKFYAEWEGWAVFLGRAEVCKRNMRTAKTG